MGFQNFDVRMIFYAVNGKCERCGKKLDFDQRGRVYGDNGWEAHHKKAASKTGTDNFTNIEILCYACHKKTSSFGVKGRL